MEIILQILIFYIQASTEILPSWFTQGGTSLIAALLGSILTFAVTRRGQKETAEGTFRGDLLKELTALRVIVAAATKTERDLQKDLLKAEAAKAEIEVRLIYEEDKRKRYYDCIIDTLNAVEAYTRGDLKTAMTILQDINCLEYISKENQTNKKPNTN